MAAAAAHPIRIRCLIILSERAARPSQIARLLGVDVSKVGYHVNASAETNLIEKVSNRPVQGAVEHFYRATQLLLVGDEEETELTRQ